MGRRLRTALRQRAAGVALVSLLAAGGSQAAESRPPSCRAVAPGESLAGAVATAPAGSALCLSAGVHDGPIAIERPLTVWGPREAVIRSRGAGTTISLDAPGAALLGLTVDGSGGRFDLLDAAVRVRADRVRVEGVRVRGALFGLLAEQAREIALVGNEIEGPAGRALGLRGDGIRIWEVRDSRIEGNRLRGSRDVVVWYSPGNRIAGNTVQGGRYGTHLMYSHDNVVEGNRYESNVVGIFSMYSRGIRIHGNLLARSAGAAGMGLGAKESGNLSVVDNLFVGNQVGIYLDTSPLDPADSNRFQGNSFRYSDAAVVFHGESRGNAFIGNSFRDNFVSVRVEGRGDARDAVFRGNDWADYQGYDLDGDGIGDVPYELRSLADLLTAREPALAFFRGAPALSLVEFVGRVVPLFRPPTLLVDEQPRMEPPALRSVRAD
jgi:nitrous oxidase accessory protein